MLLKDIITCPKVPECSLTNLMDINRFCICAACRLQVEVRGVKAPLTEMLPVYHTRVLVFLLHRSY